MKIGNSFQPKRGFELCSRDQPCAIYRRIIRRDHSAPGSSPNPPLRLYQHHRYRAVEGLHQKERFAGIQSAVGIAAWSRPPTDQDQRLARGANRSSNRRKLEPKAAISCKQFCLKARTLHWLSMPDTARNIAMMKTLALAASITMLVAISGQALAGTAAPKARYWPKATDPSDQQVGHAFNAFDPSMATQTVEPEAHRYHGGPKSND